MFKQREWRWWKKLRGKLFARRTKTTNVQINPEEKGRTKAANVQINPEERDVLDLGEMNFTSIDNTPMPLIPLRASRPSRPKYGELVILGYNGYLTQPGCPKRSRFVLFKRSESNGVELSKQYTVTSPKATKTTADEKPHSISYTLSREKTVIVEYKDNADTDLFQIGRMQHRNIDFVLPFQLPNGKKGSNEDKVSRFACRILVERSEVAPKAKIFAAAFDSDNNIFLGRRTKKWQNNVEIDGLTTNGVLIMHPKGDFSSGTAERGVWRECSVGGNIFNIRKFRNAQETATKIQEETNVLQDGTLIDLCGVTLIWRSAEGLQSSTTKADIGESLTGLNTLLTPTHASSGEKLTKPYYYLKCGHMQLHLCNPQDDRPTNTLRCTTCFVEGPVIILCMGIEPAFYIDSGPPTFAFNPCGHMASEATVKYWANVCIPQGTQGAGIRGVISFKSICPFCITPLGSPSYIQLKF